MKQRINILTIAVILFLLSACTSYDFDQADTPANQAEFERHFGFPVPASVTDLYYFADEMGADVKYQIAFKTDQATIKKITGELNLIQQEPNFRISIAQDFDWWDDHVIEGLTPYWQSNTDGDYYWFLWYDPASQRAYYLEYSL